MLRPATECVLATIAGSEENERLLVVLTQTEAGRSQIVLRQQSWAEGIGWYDQKSLELDPHQLRQLKAVLGGKGPVLPREPAETPAILAFPGVRTESA
jgi:hypothetical protein